MPCRNQAPKDTVSFTLPEVFVREEACHLPQIDHLSIAQLRRRAAEDREDALGMNQLHHTGCLAMLLADAERCEARADALEMVIGGLDEATRSQIILTEVTVADIQSLAARGVSGISPGGTEANPSSSLPPTLAAAVEIAFRNRHALARV